MYNTLKFKIKLMLIIIIGLTFTTGLFAQGPNLISPADNSTCLEKSLVFSWSPVSGATAYRFQVSSSSTWSNPDVTEVILGSTSTTYSFAVPNANTNYFWRVSASFTGTEVYSTISDFKTKGNPPALINPADQETCVPIKPVFKWSGMAGATSYSLQVSYSTTFSGNDLVYENLAVSGSATSFTAQMPTNYMNYYWRMRAVYSSCNSDWSQPFLFSTKQGAPGVVNPANAASGIQLNPVLSWTEVTPSSVYDVELALDQNFSNIVQSYSNLSTTSATLTTLNYNTDYFWRVKSKLSGCESVWSSTFRFKTTFTAPLLDQPYDGRICLNLTSEFRWTSIPNAQGYQIQIATDPGFINLEVNQEGIFDQFVNATLKKGLTLHYWRVRAKDTHNTGNWSQVRTFTTTLNAVEPVYPQKNAGGIERNIVLRWSDVTYGMPGTYHLQISESPTFADTLFNIANITSTTYSIALAKNNNDYYWRVSAAYSECEVGYSTPWKFRTIITKPVLSSPADEVIDETFSIVFQWNPVPDATSYIFSMSPNPNFIPDTYGRDNIKENHYYIKGLAPDTKYFWKVKAVNQYGESEFSNVFTFTTSSKGAGIPEIQSPLLGAEQVDPSVILTWTEADRADRYHLQVASNDQLKNPFVDIDTLTVTFYQLSGLLNDSRYFWHVSAINDSGETKFSKLGHFTTKLTVPSDTPSLLTPDNGSTNKELTLVLKWTPVNYATAYEVQISKDNSFSGDMFENDSMNYATEKIVYGLEYETQYYWRARARNASGKGPWSEPYSFTTKQFVSVDDISAIKYDIQTYPNPFSESSLLSLTLPQNEYVSVTVYNLVGEEIGNIYSRELPAGSHSIIWEPGNLPNGIYIYSIKIGNLNIRKAITLVK